MTEKAFGKMFLLQIVLRPLMASHGTSGDDQKDDVVDASLHADFRRGFFTV